jgi:glutathione peroxidase
MSLYEYTVKDSKGNDVSMSDYKGKVLLIVNTATGCGFTPQYVGLQQLYDKYNAKGFEVLDFPCNQFANQAPGTEDEIQSFCISKYGTTFKLFAKIKVNGKDAEPLFQYLKKEQGGSLGSSIKWNFTKFLVDQDGKVIRRYAPTDTPESIEKDIEALVNQN